MFYCLKTDKTNNMLTTVVITKFSKNKRVIQYRRNSTLVQIIYRKYQFSMKMSLKSLADSEKF